MKNLSKIIVKEINEVFIDPNIEEVVSCFLDFVQFPLDNESLNLDGIETRLMQSINNIFNEDVEKRELSFSDFVKIEAYLRKILYFYDNAKYQRIEQGKKGLLSLLNALNLNSIGVSLPNSDPASLIGAPYFQEHISRCYQVRNNESHRLSDYSQFERGQIIRSILIVYVYATSEHFALLTNIIDKNNIKPYLRRQIDLYKKWHNLFVNIEGKEVFREIDLFAEEIIIDDEEVPIIRKGTVNDLRKSIPENQMVLLGEVGMGKSTTLQYLHVSDAENCLLDISLPIPIYIELKNIEINQTIINEFSHVLNIEEAIVKSLLTQGKFNIFLDGLNEINKQNRVNVIRQINSLFFNYPHNKIIVTSRPLGYKREFDDVTQNKYIPVFALQFMQDIQIEEFLDKNGKDVKGIILTEINTNSKLKDIIRTPLILSMLIYVVNKTKVIPKNKVAIIGEFINLLISRENKIDTIDPEQFNFLLSHWGYFSRMKVGGNSGLNEQNDVLPFFRKTKEENGLSIDVWEFLVKARDMYVLIKNGHQYSFIHELYQEYFAALFLRGRTEGLSLLSNTMDFVLDDPIWLEVIVLYSGLLKDEEYEKFIYELALKEPYIAACCDKSTIKRNAILEDYIINVATNILNSHHKIETSTKALQTLIEYSKYDLVIEYVKQQKGIAIKFAKTVVAKILDANIYNPDIWEVIKVFIDANAKYYISEINAFLKEHKSTIFYELNIIKDILSTLVLNQAKLKHIKVFAQLVEIEDMSFITTDTSHIISIIESCSTMEDVYFFKSAFKWDISEQEIIDICVQSQETSCLMFIPQYISNSRVAERKRLIRLMLETKQPTRVSAALIFIRQYGYEDNFVLNQDISSLYANQLEGEKGRNLIQKRNFIGSVLKIRQQIELAQYLSYIKNGKEVKFDILYEIPHHYIIKVKGGRSEVKYLLPKSQISNKLSKRNNIGWITFVDKSYMRIFISMNSKSKFQIEDWYYLKKNDIVKCRFSLNGHQKYSCEAKGIFIKDLRLKIIKMPKEVDLNKVHKAKIIDLNDLCHYTALLIN